MVARLAAVARWAANEALTITAAVVGLLVLTGRLGPGDAAAVEQYVAGAAVPLLAALVRRRIDGPITRLDARRAAAANLERATR